MIIQTPVSEKKFLNVLHKKQKEKYALIKKKRFNIYVKSLIFGFFIGLFYYLQINQDSCYFLAITLWFTSFLYMIHPKSERLIDYMETKDQYIALSRFNLDQKHNGIISTLIGLLIWAIIALKVICNKS